MSGRIWAVAQHRDGKLHRGSWEAVAAAQQLAAALGAEAEAIVLGHGIDTFAQELAGCELAGVRTLDAEPLASYRPGAYASALAAAIDAERPAYVLFPHSYQSSEYVPRLAQASGAAHVPEAIGFELEDGAPVWKRPILGGKLHARVRARGDGTVLVSLQAGAFAADSRRSGQAAVSALGIDAGAIAADREILGVEQAAAETVDLGKAEVIVAVGRGIGGGDKMAPIEQLAKLLRAEIGASRPVIDSGWLPRDRQIGSSGQTVSPKLYLALGISGAIQHVVGMKAAGCVVAVNKDPGAPIFKIADYGFVGDLHELVPALVEELSGSS